MKLLLVEDEARLANSLATGLKQEGYTVDVVFTGPQGYELSLSGEYDLIILDIMLPGLDGLTICQKLRQEKINTPILILTAKSTIDDKLIGFGQGADDYLTKPFDFEELLARLTALSRRPKQIQNQILTLKNLTLDLTQKQASYQSKDIPLTTKEFQVLEYLARHPSKWVTKEELITRVWSYDSNILDNTIEATIKNIRRKINKEIIATRRGIGYQLSR